MIESFEGARTPAIEWPMKKCERHGCERVWKAGERRWRCPKCELEKKRRYRSGHIDECRERDRKLARSERRMEYSRQYSRRRRREQRDRVYARAAAERAVKSGRLTRPESCPRCGSSAHRIEGHHFSYAPEDRLAVLWFCIRCHAQLDAAILLAGDDGSPYRVTLEFMGRYARSKSGASR